MKETGFKIEQANGVTIFTNYTDFVLEVSEVPVKPKRKYNLIFIIPAKSFKILDRIYEMELTKLSFHLKEKE